MTARFTLDGKGTLTPASADAQRELSAHAGPLVLAPTHPDLLVFLRIPAQGGRPGTPRVVLAGDAGGFPISDLIAFLSQSRWSGVLRVHAPGGERAVSLNDGEVRGATSEDPADRLSEVLVRFGFASRTDVERALRDNPPSKVGRALVEMGLLQAHDLWKCVSHQVSDIFHAIVLCRDGSFVLVDQEPDERVGTNVQLSTQSLLMDAIRKIDEMAHFRQRIPHGRVFVSRKRSSDGKLEPDEDRVLALADGRRTVMDLGQAANLSEFDVTKVLFRLLEGGYASVSELPHAETPAPTSSAALRVVRTFNAVFTEVLREVSRAGMGAEFLGAANAALANQALSDSPVLRGMNFLPDGSLPEATLLEAYTKSRAQLGSEPTASLKQALSDLMFFLLFQAGELLESRADEELSRRVKDLLGTLGE